MKKLLSIVLILSVAFSSLCSFAVSAAQLEPSSQIVYKTYAVPKYSSLSQPRFLQDSPTVQNHYNLSQNLISAVRAIANSSLNAEQSVDLSSFSITEDQFLLIVNQILFTEYPEISDIVQFNYSMYVGSNTINTLSFDYYGSADSVRARIQQQYQAVNDVISKMGTDLSDLQKIKAVHDYLVLNVQYDYLHTDIDSVPHDSFSAYGALINHIAVCQGYSQAFQLFMNKLNINSLVVTSEEMDHAWNMIQLNGNWYHVDVTWNDPVPDRPNMVDYSNFLVSDNTISDETHNHTGWNTDAPKATDTQYENVDWSTYSFPKTNTVSEPTQTNEVTYEDTGISCNGISYKGSVTLDTKSYTLAPGNIYTIGVKLAGNANTKTYKVISSRTGIATVAKLANGNYRITGVNEGIAYIVCTIYDTNGKEITHASIKVTVQKGVKQYGLATRSTSYIDEVGIIYGGKKYNGAVTLDTQSYTLAPGNIYTIGVKLVGNAGTKTYQVISSRTGIATVAKLPNGNYRITGLKEGIAYIVCTIYDTNGQEITHASIKVTVQRGVQQHGVATRSTSYFN